MTFILGYVMSVILFVAAWFESPMVAWFSSEEFSFSFLDIVSAAFNMGRFFEKANVSLEGLLAEIPFYVRAGAVLLAFLSLLLVKGFQNYVDESMGYGLSVGAKILEITWQFKRNFTFGKREKIILGIICGVVVIGIIASAINGVIKHSDGLTAEEISQDWYNELSYIKGAYKLTDKLKNWESRIDFHIDSADGVYTLWSLNAYDDGLDIVFAYGEGSSRGSDYYYRMYYPGEY